MGESKAQKLGEAGAALPKPKQRYTLRLCIGLHCHMEVYWTLHMSIDLVRPSDATSATALLGDWMPYLQCPADAILQLPRAKGGFSVKTFPCVVCRVLVVALSHRQLRLDTIPKVQA